MISASEGISKQLRGWLHSLQNSDIEGTRYLTDAARAERERRRKAEVLVERLRQAVPPRGPDGRPIEA